MMQSETKLLQYRELVRVITSILRVDFFLALKSLTHPYMYLVDYEQHWQPEQPVDTPSTEIGDHTHACILPPANYPDSLGDVEVFGRLFLIIAMVSFVTSTGRS